MTLLHSKTYQSTW